MHSTARLSELIRRKQQVLTQLHETGRRQMELVNGADIGALLTLLAAKQQLIAALQAVEQELTPYYSENPDHRAWSSPQERVDCAQRVAACNAMLEEIVLLEKAGTERITVRRDEVAQQLHHVHSAAQVRGAYVANRSSRAS